MGLSPLARGNRENVFPSLPRWGTIPARAGEPNADSVARVRAWDYPRSRGGTTLQNDARGDSWGLSPLARGNLPEIVCCTASMGTIPARAGEPDYAYRSWCLCGDYPRSRGGTHLIIYWVVVVRGLSPLARGNLENIVIAFPQVGTIPARAGEPKLHIGVQAFLWDYPRSRGGTSRI